MSLEDLYSGRAGGMEGSDAEFKARLWTLIQNMPDELAGQVTIISAYRSEEHQQELYDKAVAKYGAAEAGKWAAPPGRSNHNHGLAMDLRYGSEAARKWVHQNAARFGLNFPMAHEPWHIEPLGVRDGTYNHDDWDHGGDDEEAMRKFFGGNPEAYTDGGTPVDNHSLETQLLRLSDIMTGGKFNALQQLRVSDPRKLLENNMADDQLMKDM